MLKIIIYLELKIDNHTYVLKKDFYILLYAY